jgi:hypothetical protein
MHFQVMHKKRLLRIATKLRMPSDGSVCRRGAMKIGVTRTSVPSLLRSGDFPLAPFQKQKMSSNPLDASLAAERFIGWYSSMES